MSIRRVISTLAVLLVAVGGTLVSGAGCGQVDGELSGSLGEFYNLQCDAVRSRLYDSELSIEYINGTTGEISVRVTVVRTVQDPTGPAEINLVEAGDVTGSSNGNLIPRFSEGVLRLETYSPVEGADVIGNFDVTFNVGVNEVNLRGEFDTSLQLIDFF